MSEHEPQGDEILRNGDEGDTIVDAAPVAFDGDGDTAEKDADVRPMTARIAPLAAHSGNAVEYYPLVQMDRLAHAIQSGSPEQVRRMHGVFLGVFYSARKDFFTFLQSLDAESEQTPTALYHAAGDGGVLPIADVVSIVDEGDSPADRFMSVAAAFDANMSPVFNLTRVKPAPTPSVNYADILDPETAGLEELGTGDEITARKLPPVVMKEDLLDLTSDARLLTPTPSPGIPVYWDVPESSSPGIVVEFSYSPINSSTDTTPTPSASLRLVLGQGDPTPTREAPQWLWTVFTTVEQLGGIENMRPEDIAQMERDISKSAE